MEIKNNIYSSIEQITGQYLNQDKRKHGCGRYAEHVLRGCVKTTVEEK